MQALAKFLPIILGIQFLFVTVACALVISMDVKFRKYVDKTLDFYDDSTGSLLGTFVVTGAFAWVHFNVFSGAFGFVSMAALHLASKFTKVNPFVTLAIHAVNWLTFLIGFALIAANLYSMAWCDILSTDVKITFCQIPRAILGIDVITWLFFCITLGWYILSIMRSRKEGIRSEARGNQEHKEEAAGNATELDEQGNPKTAV